MPKYLFSAYMFYHGPILDSGKYIFLW